MSSSQEGFSKEMQQKFLKDLQNIQIGDSDSELQGSSDFYQVIKQRLNNEILHNRQSTAKNTILQQLKSNINKQLINAQSFEQQLKQMKIINTATHSSILQQKMQQIKQRIAKQNINQSLVLADQQVQIKQRNSIIVQEPSFQQIQAPEITNNNNNQTKNTFKKKKNIKANTINFQIERKIQNANLQRERIFMERQDQQSMKYQYFVLSQFFKQRFLHFQLPSIPKSIVPLNIPKVKKPQSTFTNLVPLANNQKNVLPKNSPQIALKSLKNGHKVQLEPVSKTTIKIQFKPIAVYKENQQTYDKINTLQTNSNDKDIDMKVLSSKMKQLLSPYLLSIRQPLKQLQGSSVKYSPSFIKTHLNQNQKVSNIQISISEQKSLSQLIQSGKQSKQKFKQFKLTFQNVIDVKGIQNYPNIQYLALQHNLIKNVQQVQMCHKLIQLNLSYNKIRDLKSIQQLTSLRYLNFSYNQVREFQFKGGSLQILYAKHNTIQVVNDLNANQYLRVADFTDNKLHQVGKAFTKLHFLQQLYLSKNYIDSISGIEKLLMLQKLDMSHNRLQILKHPLIYMFLCQLDISYNQVAQVPSFFLPSLQKLYITNNKLIGKNLSSQIMYLPQLKQLNLDDNQIKGFSSIWFFVRYSRKLEIIKYDSNQYFLALRQKVRELYQAIIYKHMNNLKIINHSPMDTGIKAYYQSVYNVYLQNANQLHTQIQDLSQFVSFILRQNQIILQLQNQYGKKRNQMFTQTDIFIKSKSVKRVGFLKNLIQILHNKVSNEHQNLPNENKNVSKKHKNVLNEHNNVSKLGKNQKKESINSLIRISESIYYQHDRFQSNLLKKLHIIKSFFCKLKYKSIKKQKYFISRKSHLITLFNHIQSFLFKLNIHKTVKRFSNLLTNNRQAQAALKIQSLWRGYKCRKLFNKMIKKLHDDQDSFQMQEVDLNDFQNQQFPEFNFDMPQGIDFDQYIIQPKYFELATNQATNQANIKAKRKSNQLDQIQEKQQQYQPFINNFMKQQKIQLQKTKKKQDDQRLMKEWGFQNPASLQALKWKKKRKQEMKKKQAIQNMTAAQRFERFKNNR